MRLMAELKSIYVIQFSEEDDSENAIDNIPRAERNVSSSSLALKLQYSLNLINNILLKLKPRQCPASLIISYAADKVYELTHLKHCWHMCLIRRSVKFYAHFEPQNSQKFQWRIVNK